MASRPSTRWRRRGPTSSWPERRCRGPTATGSRSTCAAKRLRDVPVLLLSGAFESVDEARLASCGADGVLEKPVEPTVVINRVQELLGLKSDERRAGGSFDYACARSRGETPGGDDVARRHADAPHAVEVGRAPQGAIEAKAAPVESRRAARTIIAIASTPRSIRSISSSLAACRARRPLAIPRARSASRAAPPIRDRRAAGPRAATAPPAIRVRGR